MIKKKVFTYNKNIKIEGITNEKIKLKIKAVSSVFSTSDIDFTLTKNKDIKEKYIEIIQALKEKNEYLIKREIYQEKKQNKIKNINSYFLNNNALSNSYHSLNKEGILNNSDISLENKLIGKKKKRKSTTVNKTSKMAKKNNQNKKAKIEENNKNEPVPPLEYKKENVNINENNYNELYQRLIKQEQERLANVSKQLYGFD